MIEVPPEVTPERSSLQLNTTFSARHPTQDIHLKRTFTSRHSPQDFRKGMGLEHIGPFLGAIMQLKPANTGILSGDCGDAD